MSATYQHNTSQHCWAQHVACVWHHVAACCNMLGIENRAKYCKCPDVTLRHEHFKTSTTASCNIRKCWVRSLNIFKFEPAKPNMSQQGGQTLRLNVAIIWPGLNWKCCKTFASDFQFFFCFTLIESQSGTS